MKGEIIMNKYTMYAGTAAAMQTAEAKDEKKTTLWERFKNYLIENVYIIAPVSYTHLTLPTILLV